MNFPELVHKTASHNLTQEKVQWDAHQPTPSFQKIPLPTSERSSSTSDSLIQFAEQFKARLIIEIKTNPTLFENESLCNKFAKINAELIKSSGKFESQEKINSLCKLVIDIVILASKSDDSFPTPCSEAKRARTEPHIAHQTRESSLDSAESAIKKVAAHATPIVKDDAELLDKLLKLNINDRSLELDTALETVQGLLSKFGIDKDIPD